MQNYSSAQYCQIDSDANGGDARDIRRTIASIKWCQWPPKMKTLLSRRSAASAPITDHLITNRQAVSRLWADSSGWVCLLKSRRSLDIGVQYKVPASSVIGRNESRKSGLDGARVQVLLQTAVLFNYPRPFWHSPLGVIGTNTIPPSCLRLIPPEPFNEYFYYTGSVLSGRGPV